MIVSIDRLVSAPCAYKRLHALGLEISFFSEHSTKLLHDKGISVSGRIDGAVDVAEEVWKSDKM